MRLLVQIGFGVALLLVGYGAGLVTQPWVYQAMYKRAYARKEKHYLNHPAENFRVTTLDGTTWELSAQRGKIVVLDFTATWCAPCVGAYPILKSVYAAHSGDGQLSMLSIALDEHGEEIKKHFAAYELPWPVAHEEGKIWDNSVASAYEVRGIPSIWIIDRQGRVAAMNAWGDGIGATVDRLVKQTD